MDYIVDVQGFKKPIDEFVLKELSIIEVKGDEYEPLTLLLKPPCAWTALPEQYKIMNSWLQRNYHGITWNSGDISDQVAAKRIRDILKHARTIFVKGLEKKRWIARFMKRSLSTIVDMESLDCPSLQKLPTILSTIGCPHHANMSKYNCADANVKSLKMWLKPPQALCNKEIS